MRFLVAAITASFVLALTTSNALAVATIAEVVCPGGSTVNGITAINDSGLVAGGATFPGSPYNQPFFFNAADGTCTQLATLPDRNFTDYKGGVAVDISDSGFIVGASGNAGSNQLSRGTRWSAAAPLAPTDLGAINDDGQNHDEFSYANSVNEAGIATGWAAGPPSSDQGQSAVRFNGNGTLTDINPASGGNNTSRGVSINDGGTVLVSNREGGSGDGPPFLWKDDAGTDILGPDSDRIDFDYQGFADDGTVFTRRGGTEKAAKWKAGGWTDLGQLPGTTQSTARAVNDSGVAVGQSDSRAVTWAADGSITDLNSLLPPDSGWILANAADVNDSKQIIGTGSLTVGGSTRYTVQFLLTLGGLVVNDNGDAPDANANDGSCITAEGKCTLRAAVQQANALSGEQEITFDIPGGGRKTISPKTALPAVEGTVKIDGLSQPGRPDGEPGIEVDGFGGGTGDGLVLTGSGSTVRGLVVTRYLGNGIVLGGEGHHIVEASWIGARPSAKCVDELEASCAAGNGRSGILATAGDNRIGAPEALDQAELVNRIAFNGRAGIAITGGMHTLAARNLFAGNGTLAIDLGDDGPTPNDAKDADEGPNGLLNRTVIWSQEADIGGGTASWRRYASGAPGATLTVKTFTAPSCPANGQGGGEPVAAGGDNFTLLPFVGQGLTFPLDAKGIALGSDFITYPKVPAGHESVSQVVIDASGNTSELSNCAIDKDGDGINDVFEGDSADVDGDGTSDIDLKALGAVAGKKDIFVEMDAMKGHRYSQEAIERVRDAFAHAPVGNPNGSRGIRLHVDNGPSSKLFGGGTWGKRSRSDDLAHDAVLGSLKPDDSEDFTEPLAIKKDHFETLRSLAFHYVIVGHELLAPGDGTLGVSRGIPGSDIMIGLAETCPNHVDCPGDVHDQAVTFMHELGHNLGLGHGGDDDDNEKPNYVSIMNYNYAFDGLSDDGGRTKFIDYSRVGRSESPGDWGAMGLVDEAKLDEPRGVAPSGHAGRLDVLWRCPPKNRHRAGRTQRASRGGFDWNCDGHLTKSSGFDITANGSQARLQPYNDWAALELVSGLVIGHSRVGALQLPPGADAPPKGDMPFPVLREIVRAVSGDRRPPVARIGKLHKHTLVITARDKGRLRTLVVTVDRKVRQVDAKGRHKARLKLRLKKGRHQIVAYASDTASNTSRAVKRRVRVR